MRVLKGNEKIQQIKKIKDMINLIVFVRGEKAESFTCITLIECFPCKMHYGRFWGVW